MRKMRRGFSNMFGIGLLQADPEKDQKVLRFAQNDNRGIPV